MIDTPNAVRDRAIAEAREAERQVAELRAALALLCDEIADTGDHGDGAYDEACKVCRVHANARALLANERAVKIGVADQESTI